jgi:hypothetical protein
MENKIEIIEILTICVLLFFIFIHYITTDHQIEFINTFINNKKNIRYKN